MKLKTINLVALVLLSAIIFSGIDAKAEEGNLFVDNRIDSKQSAGELNIGHSNYPGVTDGYDGFDTELPPIPLNNSVVASFLDSLNLNRDLRTISNKDNFDLRLIYDGTLTEDKQNHLEFSFPDPDYSFGDKPILFQQTDSTNPNAFYPVYDVRKVIEAGVTIQLEDVAAGTYNQWIPYGSGRLDIGTRYLADLDDNGTVDLYDLTPMGNDWGKTGVDSIADISGPNGLPDKNVDMWDLKAHANDYLKSVNN